MILSAQTILSLCNPPALMGFRPMITPFFATKHIFEGMSFGLSSCGYDIRVAQDLVLFSGGFVLGSSVESFVMPRDVMGKVTDKSSLARKGLSVFNTVIEPGWEGFLTLELKNQGEHVVRLVKGQPIAQVIFQRLDFPTMFPYQGKYQNQGKDPVESIHEVANDQK